MDKILSITRSELKSVNHKVLGLTAVLFFGSNKIWAAGESTQIVISDTMIFSLFLFSAVVLLMIIYAQVSAMKSMLDNKDLWFKKEDKNNTEMGIKLGLITAALLLGNQAVAQAGVGSPLIVMTDQLYWIMIALNGFLLGIVIILYYVLQGLINSLRGVEDEVEEDIITSITARLTDAVPLEKKQEILLNHNYIGIREWYNNLPPWLKYGFYISIVFTFVYMTIYLIIGAGDLQDEEYKMEMKQAKLEIEAYMSSRKSIVNESNLIAIEDVVGLELGKKVFVGKCLVCHGANGEGIVGPNLTDEHWITGGGIKNIYNSIKTGIPEKGMISWESKLTPAQILEVSSYILSLQGTNPPNAKSAEGEIWKEESATTLEESKPDASF